MIDLIVKTFSNKFICKHAKSGKCDGIFTVFKILEKCGHHIPHKRKQFQVGYCSNGRIKCEEAKLRGLKNPIMCVPIKIIDDIIDKELFEI